VVIKSIPFLFFRIFNDKECSIKGRVRWEGDYDSSSFLLLSKWYILPCFVFRFCVRVYCHVSGIPWLIITGSGLDDWIYWHFLFQALLITINYNSSQSMSKTRSIPYWTSSVFSYAVTDLVLIYESVTSSTNDLRITNTEWRLTYEWTLESNQIRSQSQSYITTDGRSASVSWNKSPMWSLQPDLFYCQTVTCLLMRGALSDDRMGL
jgi:hypothetical protein